jgi:hypothetical protein
MACQDVTSGALTMLSNQGKLRSLGHKYTVLGWIDNAHLLVELDASTLGVLSTADGTVVRLAQADADQVDMAGTLPGGF